MNEVRLSEQGQMEAQIFLDGFKREMEKIVDEVLGEAYVNCMPHIEADSWLNFRNHAMAFIKGYRDLPGYEAKSVREAILKHHREQIIADLNQDHLDRIKELESQVQHWKDLYYDRMGYGR